MPQAVRARSAGSGSSVCNGDSQVSVGQWRETWSSYRSLSSLLCFSHSVVALHGYPDVVQEAMQAIRQSIGCARLEPALRSALKFAGLSLVEQSTAEHVRMLTASTRTELQAFLRALGLPHLIDADWAQIAAGHSDLPDVPLVHPRPPCPIHDHPVTSHAQGMHTKSNIAVTLSTLLTSVYPCDHQH